jgi:hypothetical protein
MANDMPIMVEVWPLAADEAGIWLVSGGEAWCTNTPVQSDSDPHGDVELLLAMRGAGPDTVLLHSTSWRTDLPRLVVTYVAVVNAGPAVRVRWPLALPVSLEFAGQVRPKPHGPAERPTDVADDAVLVHAVRHLAWLRETDPGATASLDDVWRAHLSGLRPALAGLYSVEHSAA